MMHSRILILVAALRADPRVLILGAALRADPRVLILGAALRADPRVLILGASLPLLCLLAVGCTDPVRQAQIDKLGPEDPAVPVGPDHRPGQACVLCHSEGGPASSKAFAIAGTV